MNFFSSGKRKKLERALENKASFEEIRQLVDSNPGILGETNWNGDTPLHLACLGKAPLEVIQWLVDRFPSAVEMKNTYGNTPLHLACYKKAPLEVIQLLVERFPDAVEMKNMKNKEGVREGNTPLHLACFSKAPLEVIQLLVDRFPGAVEMKNTFGNTPLDYCDADTKDKICLDEKAAALRQKQEAERQFAQVCQNQRATWKSSKEIPTRAALEQLIQECQSPPPSSLSRVQSARHRANQLQRQAALEKLRPVMPDQATLASTIGKLNEIAESFPDTVQGTERKAEFYEEIAHWEARLEREESVPMQPPQPAVVAPPKMYKPPPQQKPQPPKNAAVQSDRDQLRPLIEKNKRDQPVQLSVEYIESIKTSKELGKGFFGVVFRGWDPVLKQEFAVKQIHEDIVRHGHTVDVQTARETFQTELDTLLEFNHPNIACLYGYHLSQDLRGHQYLVFELAEKGSLDKFWESDLGRDRLSSVKLRIEIALDVTTALHYLHKGGDTKTGKVCCHRDIKSANICLTRDLGAKLIDAGLAKLLPENESSNDSSAIVGQSGYRDPQYEGGSVNYQPKCDVFSLGIVLTELITGRLQNHLAGKEKVNFYEKYTLDGEDMKDDFDPALDMESGKDAKCMKRFSEIALKCIRRKIGKRPTSQEVMEDLRKALQEYEIAQTEPTVDLGALETRQTCRMCKEVSICLSCKGTQKHYHCQRCMSRHIESCVDNVWCPFTGCNSVPFNDDETKAFVEPGAWITYSMRQPLIDLMREHHTQQMKAHHLTHSKLNESLCLLTNIGAGVHVRCPRLFLLVEAEPMNRWRHPRSWLRGLVRKKWRLFFVCSESYSVIQPPLKFRVGKEWVERIAPALALSLALLKVAGNVYGFDCPIGPEQIGAMDDELKPLLSVDDKKVLKRAEMGSLTEQDVQRLDGSAFELVAERAMANLVSWRDQMAPVRKDGAVVWVKKEYESRYA